MKCIETERSEKKNLGDFRKSKTATETCHGCVKLLVKFNTDERQRDVSKISFDDFNTCPSVVLIHARNRCSQRLRWITMQELDESVFLTPVFPQIAHALVQTLKMDNTRSSADPVSESSHVGFFFFPITLIINHPFYMFKRTSETRALLTGKTWK